MSEGSRSRSGGAYDSRAANQETGVRRERLTDRKTELQCTTYCNQESITQCTPVPYMQVDDQGTVTI